VADDIKLRAVDVDGVPGEWSIAPASDESRVLMFLHGDGYCSGSIVSHRRMVTEAGRAAGVRTLAIGYRLARSIRFPQPSMMRSSRGAFCAGKASAGGASPSAATVPAAA
jgi:acetyl esterase/lipase